MSKIELGSKIDDNRGYIQNILNISFNHCAMITSKAGSIRSNHYHLTNSHYIFVVSGEMEYWERNLDGSDNKMILCKPNDLIFTGSNLIHKTVFTQDSVIMTFAANYRGPEFDQEDTVHMEF